MKYQKMQILLCQHINLFVYYQVDGTVSELPPPLLLDRPIKDQYNEENKANYQTNQTK